MPTSSNTLLFPNLVFKSQHQISNLSSNLVTFKAVNRVSISTSIDVAIGIPRGSTVYNTDSLLPYSRRRQLVSGTSGVIYAQLTTTISMGLFPELNNDVSVLYDLLFARLNRAVYTGNLTSTLQRISKSTQSINTMFATCTNATIGSMQSVEANYNLNSSPKNENSKVTTSQLPVMISIIILGALVFFLIVYSLIRYFHKLSSKYKQAMEITAQSLDDLSITGDRTREDFSDIDLDKLNYIADVSNTQR